MKKKTCKKAYSELYVDDAQRTVAHAFDYAVNKMKYSLEEFTEMFVSFEYVHLLETGNPRYVAGMSGIELAAEICGRSGKKMERLPYNPGLEYWTGYIASYYQWDRNITYKELFEKFGIERFRAAYPTFHECNKKRMFEYMDEIILKN